MVCQDYKRFVIVALTAGGCQTALRLGSLLPEADIYLKAGALSAAEASAGARVQFFNEPLAQLIDKIYGQYQGFVMIMAAGIVFRTLAPHAVHKSQDPAVVVMDERARFAISLLSGHLGGANRLARRIAGLWGEPCQAVITTATDVTDKPAFDLLAQANGCLILNLPELKYISGTLVNGGRVALQSSLPLAGTVPPEVVPYDGESRPPCPDLVLISHYHDWPFCVPGARHVLRLLPCNLLLGVGCKRDTSAELLQAALEDFLARNWLDVRSLSALASVDVKKDEPGLLTLAARLNLPLLTYAAAELEPLAANMAAEEQSAFVRQTVGTPSVAQAAALKAAGEGGRTLISKTKYPGITFSVAERSQTFNFDLT